MITPNNFPKKIQSGNNDPLNQFFDQLPDSNMKQSFQPPHPPQNVQFNNIEPMQNFNQPMQFNRNTEMRGFNNNIRASHFPNSGFANSRDLLLQQFLFDNIHKQKGRSSFRSNNLKLKKS
jgi:hypothetical protein